MENNLEQHIVLGAKNFKPEKVKISNKVLREKSHCVACRSNKSRFLKQKVKLTINFIIIRWILIA